jgi:hypothetical protein
VLVNIYCPHFFLGREGGRRGNPNYVAWNWVADWRNSVTRCAETLESYLLCGSAEWPGFADSRRLTNVEQTPEGDVLDCAARQVLSVASVCSFRTSVRGTSLI